MTAPAIYLDYSATTPCDPRVVARMLPFFGQRFGNTASADHAFGWDAAAAVEAARAEVAALVGAEPKEILFTSGATESNNLAIKGTARAYRSKGDHVVTGATEHPSVLEPIERLEQEGFRVTQLPVDARGHVDLAALRAAITDSTVLVSLMAANNEIGTLHPVAEIGALCKQRGVLFHCDATQAAGRVPLDVHAFGIDLLSLSAHKMYGPKGVGALYVRRRSPRVRLAAQLDGGGHERGMRSGTLNVAGIVGFGEAARIAAAELATDQERIGILRDRLEAVLCDAVPDAVVHGDPAARLCHLTHVSFPGVAAEELLGEMREIAVSTGSACSSASRAPSHVLRAIGVPDELARCSIRFTLGRPTTADEIDSAAERVAAAVSSIRRRNAEYRKGKEPADRLA